MDLQDNSFPPPIFSFMEEEERPKKRLADPITTPRRGPLALSKSIKRVPQHTVVQRTKTHHHHQLPKQRWLNRFPVPNMLRPIDAIESSLGVLSVAELRQQAIIVSEINMTMGYL